MNYKKLSTLLLSVIGITAMTLPASAALTLEGQSGVFLNPLAYPIVNGKVEVSSHYVGLNSLGNVTSFNAAGGIGKNLEVGLTRISSSVSGVSDQTNLLAKWQFLPETQSAPAIAVWAIDRNLSVGGSDLDYGLSASKVVKVGTVPVLLDLGARSTKSLGLGLFGVGSDRQLKFEGLAAVFVTPKLIVGTEFKDQIGGSTWQDIAVRYVASDTLNIDAGLADLGPGLGSQLALGVTLAL